MWNLHTINWRTTMAWYAILSSKEVLICGLKNPWEQAPKPEGKFNNPASFIACHSPIQRGGNNSLYVHTDLLQTLNVQVTVINKKFEIKLKSSSSSIMIKHEGKQSRFFSRMSRSQELPINILRVSNFVLEVLRKEGTEKGIKQVIPSGRGIVNRNKVVFHTLPWQSSYWNWKIVTQREDGRFFFSPHR